MAELWVCPSCNVLLGIDIIKDKSIHCVNCGTKHKLDDIGFIDNNLVSEVMRETEEVVPEQFHKHIIYRWLSNRTVGILFDMDEDHMYEYVDIDLYSYFEDDVADKLDLFITVDFEW